MQPYITYSTSFRPTWLFIGQFNGYFTKPVKSVTFAQIIIGCCSSCYSMEEDSRSILIHLNWEWELAPSSGITGVWWHTICANSWTNWFTSSPFSYGFHLWMPVFARFVVGSGESDCKIIYSFVTIIHASKRLRCWAIIGVVRRTIYSVRLQSLII